jgi:hypothetical protein
MQPIVLLPKGDEMKKDKARLAVRKRIQNQFYAWCEETKRDPNADAMIAFDKAHKDYKLLDHKKAQEEGYYFHLRAQAAALISSWATVERFTPSGGASLTKTAGSTSTSVRVQDSYELNRGRVRVAKMDEADLKELIGIFQIEAEHKMQRAYLIARRLEKLTETRKQFRTAFDNAEESAYSSVTAA